MREITIGHSLEGRPLEGVEIADDVRRTDDGRPVNLDVGLIHAREWTSGELVMEFAHQLAEDDAPRFARVRARTRTFVFPLLNPDGYEISRTTEPLHRTNAEGVDLNRNFGMFWGGPGESDEPGDLLYRGPKPFSEPESRALNAFSAGHQIATVNIVHSFGRQVLYQPGLRLTAEPGLPARSTVPGARSFEALARRMAAAAEYDAEPDSALGDTTGAAEDGIYFNQFASAYTIEVGREFQPPYEEGVIDEYPRVAGALLIAAEAGEDRDTHAVLQGTAPASTVLRLSRTVRYRTSNVITGTNSASPRTGGSRRLSQRFQSTLTVPASGRFTWAVNPSQRPLAILAHRTEAWTLTCGSERRQVVLRRAQTRTLHLSCQS